MRRKTVMCILGMCIVMGISGCNAQPDPAPVEIEQTSKPAEGEKSPMQEENPARVEEKQETTQEKNVDSKTKQESVEKNPTIGSQTEESEKFYEQKLFSVYNNTIVGEDDNGKIVTLLDGASVFDDSQFINDTVAYQNDILISVIGYKGQGDEAYSVASIYSLNDLLSGKKTPIFEAKANEVAIQSAKNGILYAYVTYDEEYNEHYFVGSIVAQSDGTYKQEENYPLLEETIEQNSYKIRSLKVFLESLDKKGLAYLANDSANLLILDTKGGIFKECELPYNWSFVRALAGEWLIYDAYEYPNPDSYMESYTRIVAYNIKTEECRILYYSKENPQNIDIIGYLDGSVIYAKTDDSEYNHNRYSVYYHNLDNDIEERMYSTQDMAGGKGVYVIPGITGFAIKDDRCIVLDYCAEGINWHSYLFNSNQDLRDTGINVYPITLTQYGDVSYVSKNIETEEGKKAYSYYVEIFQLNTPDAGVDKMNRQLIERAQFIIDQQEGFAKDALDMMAEDEYYEPNFYEEYISEVRKIGRHYYAIEYSGYEYYGGAHGMPLKFNTLYDAVSGDEVSFDKLYKGTEEEFKDIVAKYTVAYWQENPEPFYGWESEEEAYTGILEDVTLGHTIMYYEDHLQVVFYPYELGPFASGFIEVDIPYSEFGLEEMRAK